MKNLRITVNGTAYDVQVEELGGSSAPAAAAPPAFPLKEPASGRWKAYRYACPNPAGAHWPTAPAARRRRSG